MQYQKGHIPWSTGKAQHKDLTGTVFGNLIAIDRAGMLNRKEMHWNCTCFCGKSTIVTSSRLQTGKTESCGCLAREKSNITNRTKALLRNEDRPFVSIMCQYRTNARRKGHDWLLSQTCVKDIIKQNCLYCNGEPDNCYSYTLGEETITFKYNGIDRFDNSKGYTDDNVVPCCFQCNKSKGKLSGKEFADWLKRANANMEVRQWQQH